MNLVWLRNDLRLQDNAALHAACQQGPTVCVYVISPKQWETHHDAPAKLMLWRDRLAALSAELHAKNIPLKIITTDDYSDIATRLIATTKKWQVTQLFFNHEYPLNEKGRDKLVAEACLNEGIDVHTFHGDVIHPPGSVRTKADGIYSTYTPFSRQWRKQIDTAVLDCLPAPSRQAPLDISSDDITQHWPHYPHTYRQDLWPVTTKAIKQKLARFAAQTIDQYKTVRDFPGIAGTSTLSPYLACGAISVRQCIAAARQHSSHWLENTWVNELIWREFYRHLTDAYPHLSRSENFKATNKAIPWENNQVQWEAWCKGETGYPIVDAAMKQLEQTGWMHNRLRMITAAFLTKLLLIDWRKGETFFMEKLVDGDYASNNGGWQWAASTGADAVPYFRIFNPERQSRSFDPDGQFIKKFLPTLAKLDSNAIHMPSSQQRQDCGYPEPVIDYSYARQRALDSYASAMGKGK